MVFSYNLWFQIYSIIISKYYQCAKQIKALVLVISLSLCSNSVVALADDKVTIGYNEQALTVLIASAEKKHQIPSGLLTAIAKTESGIKAYALNVGGRSVFPASISAAQGMLEDKVNAGVTNIDVGVMQLNYRWHANGFANTQEMLNPKRNIEYAAKLLKSLKARHGSWHKAVRYYHSATPEHHKKYSRKVVMCWLNS
jgi:soluble lytic murein transglycosylase-like protein